MASDAPTETTSSARTSDTAGGRERAVFLFDGDCAFCTTCSQFIDRRIPTAAEVTPWQFADLRALGVAQADAEEAVIWVAPDGTTAAAPMPSPCCSSTPDRSGAPRDGFSACGL